MAPMSGLTSRLYFLPRVVLKNTAFSRRLHELNITEGCPLCKKCMKKLSFGLKCQTPPVLSSQKYLGPSSFSRTVISMCQLIFVRGMAGHSHWTNIKFKKMHKDVEKSKVFGKLSLEIITAVRENGPEPATNSKLDSIISRAKATKMPKDSIESAIKSALRAGSEARTQMLFEVRGPGKCGILLDILSPNIMRSRAEIKAILKKFGGVLGAEGSVLFMFQSKGVVTVEGGKEEPISENEVEEAAILSGAENFYFDSDEDQRPLIRFTCDPIEVKSIAETLSTNHSLKTIAATQEYVATNLTELSEERMTQADKLLEHLSGHPDVMRVFDNIRLYPSSTFKIEETH